MRLSFYYAQGVRHIAREFSVSFYHSKEWKKVRKFVLMRDNYLCQICGAPAEEVHHKIHQTPRNIWNVSITLNPDNLVSVCTDCHFSIHKHDKDRRKDGLSEGDCATGYHFDESGQLVPD